MILASNSPRRKEILKDLGFKLKIIPADIDETSNKEDIIEKVIDIAYKKASSISKKYKNEFILSADTIVEISGDILGKPTSKEDIYRYLKLLSGKVHRVITAFALRKGEVDFCIKEYFRREDECYQISNEQIEWYIKTEEPFDKAGGYGIQGLGRIFVKEIKGDFFSIMGFPISKFIASLEKLGYKINEIDKI